MKQSISLAGLAAFAQAQSNLTSWNASCCRMPAISNGCNCGCTTASCTPTVVAAAAPAVISVPKQVYSKVRVCTDKETVQLSTSYKIKTEHEKKIRKIEKTVMVPTQEMRKQLKTVQKPVVRTVQKTRIDYQQQLRTRMKLVNETYQKSTLVPSSCSCYQRNCWCQGQANCGCCYPTCGCAPSYSVQLTNHVRQKQVPEHYYESVPVQVPYTEEQTHMVSEQILHEVPVTVMKPRIVYEEIEELVPKYSRQKVVTSTPVTTTECKDVLVEDTGRIYNDSNASNYERVQLAAQWQQAVEKARGKAMGTVNP